MKRLDPTDSVILAAVILFAATTSCNIGQTEEKTTLFDQYYIIESTSLMDSLKSGDINVFATTTEEPELLPVEQQLPVDWLQADYFYIVNTLYEGYLGKTLDGWQLQGMDFDLGCSRVDNGFQNGRFEFFQLTKEKDQEARISRFIDIDPRGNFIHIKEWKYYPNLINLEVIDLAKLRISADIALQIAERNGGEEKRQAIRDVCDISLSLFPNAAGYRGWAVIYTRSDDPSSFFNIQIDPSTGEIYIP